MAKKKAEENLRDIDYYEYKGSKRTNNPKVGLSRYDKVAEESATYAYDPHIDPSLQWAGKKERDEFSVPSSSIHIHEVIKPLKLIRNVTKARVGENDMKTISLFADQDPIERMKKRQAEIEFYQHGVDWTNRLIAGDSLVIMNSLLEKENMAGQVQMVYFDPPYGIKYGSNFQPFINKKDVKDKADADLSQEPEMIKAFRDTWELGIHSYLSYIRDRLLLVRELLSESGSIFIQISDENAHYIRLVCDEVFGRENKVTTIAWKKGTPDAKIIRNSYNNLIWYCKNINNVKYHKIFNKRKGNEGSSEDPKKLALSVEFPDGSIRTLTSEEKRNLSILPENAKVFRVDKVIEQGNDEKRKFNVPLKDDDFMPKDGYCWRGNYDQIKRLADSNRLIKTKEGYGYKFYISDYPVIEITNLWEDTAGKIPDMTYVVQTNEKIIARCVHMTTDPDDLILDITCGSGTSPYVAEKHGRRWIACDTSRIAIDLTKQRLMTANYDYYKLYYADQGIRSGFIYKTVPHITLKDIANGSEPEKEVLYDQPEIDKSKVRVSGPFTVEALPAPVVKSIENSNNDFAAEFTAKQDDWCEELKATGILGKNGAKIQFTRVELLEGTRFVQAEAETKEDVPRRAVICFCGETKTLDSRLVDNVFDEVQSMRPTPQMIIFAAFQFDADASQMIAEVNWPNMTILKAQMNTDLMTEDLKKKRSSDQSFWLVGQPDVELIKDKRTKNRYKVVVHGFDYYDVKSGKITSGSANNIAMWMLDTDYDGLCVEPEQVFFPMGGKKDGWNKLAKTLRAEINTDLIDKFAGNESIYFEAKENSKIAVKIIDDRGIESMKVIRIGGEK